MQIHYNFYLEITTEMEKARGISRWGKEMKNKKAGETPALKMIT